MYILEIESKKITIFGSENKGSPLVVLNTYGGEGETVWNECQALGCPPFTLATVSNLDWNADMSPWENPPIYKNDGAFSGRADAYIDLLTEKIVPAVCNTISTETKPSFIALAGYSLAGLFALYTAHKIDVFSRIASASGSFWFPSWDDFICNHHPICKDTSYLMLCGRNEGIGKTNIQAEAFPRAQLTHRILCNYTENFPLITDEGRHHENLPVRIGKAIQWLGNKYID